MKSNDKVRHNRMASGFTLVEVLVALAIFSLAVIAVLPALNYAMLADQKAHRIVLATSLLQNEIEYIRANGEVSDSDPHYYDSSNHTTVRTTNNITTATINVQTDPVLPNYTISINYNTNFNSTYTLKKITASLVWRNDNIATLSTVVGNRQKHVGG